MKGMSKNIVGIFIISIVCHQVYGQTWSEWAQCTGDCTKSRTCLSGQCSGADQITCYEPNCPDGDDCASRPCQNGGSCTDDEYEFVCDCSGTGYTGQTCDELLNECLSNPCHNGGTCYDMFNYYICDCLDGITNDHCQTSVCDDPHCTACPGSSDQCDSCQVGYRLSGSLDCEACVDNCLECPYTVTVCTNCAAQYGLTFSGHCEACEHERCVECHYDPSTCTECEDRYIAIGGNCVARGDCSSSPCQNDGSCQDDANNEFVCDCSGTGYMGPTCEHACSDNCLTCPDSETGNCANCADGYGLTIDGLCIACRGGKCLGCDYDRSTCSRCESLYGAIDGSCYRCHERRCGRCDGDRSVCNQCSTGYRIQDNTCVCEGSHCSACNASQCFECGTGYKLVNGICEAGRHCYSCDDYENSVCDDKTFSHEVPTETCDGVCYITNSFSGYWGGDEWERGCTDNCIPDDTGIVKTICCDSNYCNVGSRLTAWEPVTMTVLLIILPIAIAC